MTRGDREALQRALKLLRSEPEYAAQITAKVEAEGWESAARFASYCLQIDNLGLKPWMDPPCFAEDRPDPEALAILIKLVAAGLSRYEPDPVAALARVRAAGAAVAASAK
jgi:hypothetical protein